MSNKCQCFNCRHNIAHDRPPVEALRELLDREPQRATALWGKLTALADEPDFGPGAWIPVAERLPPTGVIVATRDQGECIWLAEWDGESWTCAERGGFIDDPDEDATAIVEWAPLPQ